MVPTPPTLDPAAPGPPSAAPLRLHPRPGAYALLDAVRGLACLWVVAHHALGFLAMSDPTLSANPLYFFGLNGALGVWIFFVVSGYCIANTAAACIVNRRGGWVHARIRRIYPPCWFASLLAIASTLFAACLIRRGVLKASNLVSSGTLDQSVWFYLANLTLTQRLFHLPHLLGVYWTLCYEVGFYAVVGLWMYAVRAAGSVRLLLDGLHALTVLCLSAIHVWPQQVWYPFDLWPHFGMGVLVYDVICHGWRRSVRVCAALAGVGVVGFFLRHHEHTDYVDIGGGISLLVSASSALALLGLHRFDRRLSSLAVVRLLAWVGVFSYSLYLTHTLVIGYVFKLCQMTRVLPGLMPVYLALTVLACVGLARIFFRFFERPFLSSRRLQDSRPPTPEAFEPQPVEKCAT